jgi:hypothetical protein
VVFKVEYSVWGLGKVTPGALFGMTVLSIWIECGYNNEDG